MKPALDRFFDEVMVMVEDEALRKARLGLLSKVQKMVESIADFAHIQVG